MILGGIAAIAGMVFQPVGQTLGWLAWLVIVHISVAQAARLRASSPRYSTCG